MKVYLFDTASGLYEGESFESDDMIEYQEGITTVAPPPYKSGQVPIFDMDRQIWTVKPVSVVRERLGGLGVEKPESKL